VGGSSSGSERRKWTYHDYRHTSEWFYVI
jgi:hypothetical protein